MKTTTYEKVINDTKTLKLISLVKSNISLRDNEYFALMVIDYKTSSRPKTKEMIYSYFMQAAFYSAAYYEQTGEAIKHSAIIMAVEADEPQVFIEPTYPWLKKLMEVRNEYARRKES
jgi:hypothetical protein